MNFEALFKDLGIDQYRLVGDRNYVFKCIYPDHVERTPSFNLRAQPPYVWQCFGCGRKGNLVKLAMVAKKMNPLEAINYLERFGYVDDADIYVPEEPPTEDPLLEVPLEMFKPFREWRGLMKEAINEWELCFDDSLKRIVFPIRDIKKRLVGLVGRTTIKSSIKYYFYGDFHRGRHVYGLHRCDPSRPIVVVEGNYDAVKLWQLGIKNVCATMGATITDKQIELIKCTAKKVYLMMDNDDAGEMGAQRLIRGLSGSVDVYRSDYTALSRVVKDPGDLDTPEEAQLLYVNSVAQWP